MKKLDLARAGAAVLLILVAGCAEQEPAEDDLDLIGEDTATTATPTPAAPRTLTAQLQPTEGHEVQGSVTFTELSDGVRVAADITGLTEGEHGFHIHETGDCSAPDASSAGGHFAPDSSAHGGPDESAPDAHAGDLGNVTASASGSATYEEEFDDLTFDGPRGVSGRAVVVHADADDLESQPSGEAGERVACGVISSG